MYSTCIQATCKYGLRSTPSPSSMQWHKGATGLLLCHSTSEVYYYEVLGFSMYSTLYKVQHSAVLYGTPSTDFLLQVGQMTSVLRLLQFRSLAFNSTPE